MARSAAAAALATPAPEHRSLRPWFQALADEPFIDPELAWAVTG